MTHLTCPICRGNLDRFETTVAQTRIARLPAGGGTVIPVAEEVTTEAVDVVACGRCEFAATVADVLAGK